MNPGKTSYRLPPCPSYDIEGTESWLSDMESRGLRLEKDGFFLGLASFEPAEPAQARYRLEAAPKQASYWDENGGGPDGEALELSADYGWEYVARRGQFYIYRSADSGARELNTDPQVQALAVKEVQKRQFGSLFTMAYWCIIYPLMHIWRGASPVLAAAETGLVLTALTVALPLCAVGLLLAHALHLQKLKKRLKAGMALDHGKDWRSKRRSYFGTRAAVALMAALWLVLMLRLGDAELTHADRLPRASRADPVPFATMGDFAEGEYTDVWDDIRYDFVSEHSNAFISRGIEWSEHASIRRPDGTSLSGSLSVTYCEAKSEGFAKALAREYARFDRKQAGKSFNALPCPDLGLDSAEAYLNELHFTCIVLRQGKRVLRASFYQTGEDERMPLDEWAVIMAESLK